MFRWAMTATALCSPSSWFLILLAEMPQSPHSLPTPHGRLLSFIGPPDLSLLYNANAAALYGEVNKALQGTLSKLMV